MSQYWEALASRSNGEAAAEDFELTAYRLVSEQVIYHADRHSRMAYWLIDRYERDFRQALAPLGVDVQVNRQLRYACALPRHSKAGTASVGQTLLALVLRQIYDESARAGQLNDDGEVICDLVELEEKYRLTTGRELPGKGDLDGLLRTLKRWGIARKDEEPFPEGAEFGTSQPYAVVIRPAIADVLGETALARLADWSGNPPAEHAETEADGEGRGEPE